MSFIELPTVVSLRGEDAVQALQGMIGEFEKQKGKELTDKQADALIKVANQLIWSIKAETHSGKTQKIKRQFWSLWRKAPSSHNSMSF